MPFTSDDGKVLENAFWRRLPLQGRSVTPADVLAAYARDRTSRRSDFFLDKLQRQNIPFDTRKTPTYQVIREFNRVLDLKNNG